MHFVAPRVESRYRTLLWFDAFGLALVTVAGTVKASDVGAPALVCIAMGAVTGVVGGILRDTLGHVPSILLAQEIYVTASVLGGCTYVSLNGLGVGRFPAMIAAFLVTFGVRSLAIKFGWSIPVFGESTKRERRRSDPKARRSGSDEDPGGSFLLPARSSRQRRPRGGTYYAALRSSRDEWEDPWFGKSRTPDGSRALRAIA